MSEPLRIRDASEADAAQIAAIYAEEVLHGIATFEEVAPSAQDIAGRIKNIQRQGLPYLVAERAGKVLGYAYAGQFHPLPERKQQEFTGRLALGLDPVA